MSPPSVCPIRLLSQSNPGSICVPGAPLIFFLTNLQGIEMASIQSKKGKSGKKTHYVVISHRGGHKWIKAGSLRDAKILKKEIESLENSKRMEKLGLSANDIRIDDFFKKYADYIRPRTAANTVKRYLAVLNTFIVYLKMFHPDLKYLSQIKSEIIESYQQKLAGNQVSGVFPYFMLFWLILLEKCWKRCMVNADFNYVCLNNLPNVPRFGWKNQTPYLRCGIMNYTVFYQIVPVLIGTILTYTCYRNLIISVL
jgi:hypothetical protein